MEKWNGFPKLWLPHFQASWFDVCIIWISLYCYSNTVTKTCYYFMSLLNKYLWNKSFLSPKEDGFSRIILHNMLFNFKLRILKVKLVLKFAQQERGKEFSLEISAAVSTGIQQQFAGRENLCCGIWSVISQQMVSYYWLNLHYPRVRCVIPGSGTELCGLIARDLDTHHSLP